MKTIIPGWFFSVMLTLSAAVGSTAVPSPDRALVVLRTSPAEVFASWRSFGADPAAATSTVELAERPDGPWRALGGAPRTATNARLDVPAGRPAFLRVRVQAPGRAAEFTPAVPVPAKPAEYVAIPYGGKDRAQKVGFGDFDGDGRLDYLVKTPDFNTDPYQQPGYWKKSEDTYKLTAIRHDGTKLWTYDMGWAIEEGIWYSPIVVCDLDGDGRAEVYCKAGEGDPREPTGHVRSGSEWLVRLDGRDGRVTQRLPWPSREGFDDYNYSSRNMLGVAYLDGKRPHLLVVRGTYRIIKVQAYTPELEPLWYWEASGPHESYRGQGMHGLHTVDIDGDGRDEIILGSAALDDDGRPLWNTGKGHPDVCYVADIDPARPGLEIFYGIEKRTPRGAVALHDARTGAEIWGNPEKTIHVHSQGMVGDIVPEEPGLECYAGESKGGEGWWLYAASGKLINREDLGELAPKAIYWLDGTTKVYVSGKKIYRWPRQEVGQIPGRIVAIADFLGDWREEMVVALDGELRIYTTTVPTERRRPWLMEDPLYRNDVIHQTMGYFYPPQLSGPP
jgi:rhamnogalacturonan endolyase